MPRKFNVGKKLYLTFQEIYQHQFSSLYPSLEMREKFESEWGNALEQVPIGRISDACQKLKQPFSSFASRIPTITQFKELCLPDELELNIPTFDECFNYILSHSSHYTYSKSKLSHPFITELLKKLPKLSYWRCLPQQEATRKLQPIYDIAKKQALREGRCLPMLQGFGSDSSSEFVAVISNEQRIKEQQREDQARAHHLEKIYKILGCPDKYSTALEYRQKVIDADDEFNRP
jgi:hypothetical protein